MLWQRMPPPRCQRSLPPEILSAAFDCLDHWNAHPNTNRDDAQLSSVDGAIMTIAHQITKDRASSYTMTRRMAAYFRAPNINLAFTALRQFEHRLARFAIYVSDKLIDVATWDAPTPSPIPMTLPGIAFLQLFNLDPQFKHWPQLRHARTECIFGLQTWGADNPKHQTALTMITRYLNLTDQNC